MKSDLLKLIFSVMIVATVTSCSNDNGTSNRGNKDNDNRGNHSTDPPLPSDAEYPGSKTYDSIHRDSVRH